MRSAGSVVLFQTGNIIAAVMPLSFLFDAATDRFRWTTPSGHDVQFCDALRSFL